MDNVAILFGIPKKCPKQGRGVDELFPVFERIINGKT